MYQKIKVDFFAAWLRHAWWFHCGLLAWTIIPTIDIIDSCLTNSGQIFDTVFQIVSILVAWFANLSGLRLWWQVCKQDRALQMINRIQQEYLIDLYWLGTLHRPRL